MRKTFNRHGYVRKVRKIESGTTMIDVEDKIQFCDIELVAVLDMDKGKVVNIENITESEARKWML